MPRSSPAQRLVEALCGLPSQARVDVAVDVGGDGVGRVAEVLLDDVGVGAGGQQEAGGRVPESVQMNSFEAGTLGEMLEAPQHVARLERRTEVGGEDQAVVPPVVPR